MSDERKYCDTCFFACGHQEDEWLNVYCYYGDEDEWLNVYCYYGDESAGLVPVVRNRYDVCEHYRYGVCEHWQSFAGRMAAIRAELRP